MKERFFKDDILGNGSIFASISKDELLAQKFLIPSNDIESLFNGIVNKIDEKIALLDEEIKLLKETRDRLLPKLIRGELEV